MRIIGVNNEYTDLTEYSATEAQILYEISISSNITASYLCKYFYLDKGYLSRILKKFMGNGLIVKTSCENDKRAENLSLTEKGKKELKDIVNISNKIVIDKVDNMTETEKEQLLQAMAEIEKIYGRYYS